MNRTAEGGGRTVGCVARNNYSVGASFSYWDGSSYVAGLGDIAASNNFEAASTTAFVDPVTGDFHLAAPSPAGVDLPVPYDTDVDGLARGADGAWDVGAHEYCAGADCMAMTSVDAGAPSDAGSSSDAGGSADGGSAGRDAGTSAAGDAGSMPSGADGGAADDSSPGCSCHVGAASRGRATGTHGLLLGLLMVTLTRRRRIRSRF